MTTKAPVPHAGGKLKFTPTDWGYSLQFSHTSSTHGMALYQVAVTENYRALAVVPATGIGVTPIYPKPSVLCYIISDAQMMWGRSCPTCRCYFRTKHINGFTYCPYCTFEADSLWFLTDSQCKYLRKFVDTHKQILKEKVEIEIDLDDVTDAPEWTYEETQLQHRFECTTCQISTDILGEYGSCPSCGKRNSGAVFNKKLNEIEAQIAVADQNRMADLLSNIVSLFDAMGNDYKRLLASFPSHPERKRQISRVNFQDVVTAEQQLENWFGFNLSNRRDAADTAFLNIMFKRRHLLIHNGARVDQQYLDDTGDRQFDLHEMITIAADELTRLVGIVRQLGNRLIKSIDDIQ